MFGESASESPRLPSPWESRIFTSTPTGEGSPVQHHSLIPEEDLSGHIEYKLRLPAAPSADRLARLTSQLKWRLLEGGGEAIYEIGVCDNGLLLGIDRTEMEASLRTLFRMAEELDASLRVVREVQVSEEGIEEVQAGFADFVLGLITPENSGNSTSTDVEKAPYAGQLTFYKPTVRTQGKGSGRRLRRRPRKERRSVQHEEDLRALKQTHQAMHLSQAPVDQDLSTPSWEDVPALSHSPSPPSSTAGSVAQTALLSTLRSEVRIASDAYEQNLDGSSITCQFQKQISLSTSQPIPVCSPLSAAVNTSQEEAAQEAQRSQRRLQRKQWKQEKHRRKQAERTAAGRSGSSSRQARNRGGVFWHSTPQDSYMEALATLFNESVMIAALSSASESNIVGTDVNVINTPGETATSSSCGSTVKKSRRKQSAWSATSARPQEILRDIGPSTSASACADETVPTAPDLKHCDSLSTLAAKSQFLVVPSIKAANKGSTTALSKDIKRYAVECLIQYNATTETGSSRSSAACSDEEDERSDENDDGMSLPILDDIDDIHALLATTTASTSSSTSASARPRQKRLQSFVDFDTVWDELGENLHTSK